MAKFEFPKGTVGDGRAEWVSFSAEKHWLEADVPHVWIDIGPFALAVGVGWNKWWKPRRWKSRKRIERETAEFRRKQAEWFEDYRGRRGLDA